MNTIVGQRVHTPTFSAALVLAAATLFAAMPAKAADSLTVTVNATVSGVCKFNSGQTPIVTVQTSGGVIDPSAAGPAFIGQQDCLRLPIERFAPYQSSAFKTCEQRHHVGALYIEYLPYIRRGQVRSAIQQQQYGRL